MDQGAVGRVESAAADIAVEPFELLALEHPSPARSVHGEVNDALGALDRMVL